MTHTLRPYQREAGNKTHEVFASSQSTLCCLPTGTGKTTFASSFAAEYLRLHGGRAMVLIHMEEQVNQWKTELESFGLSVGVEMADRQLDETGMFRHQVVIASMPTLRIQKRHGKFDPEQFTLVIPDEGHHGTAPTWRRIKRYFSMNPECKFLYLTATPRRGDGMALSSVVDSVAYHYDLTSAITDGWLVPITSKVVSVTSLDFSWMDTVKGDLCLPQLQKELTDKVSHLHAVALPTIETCGDYPTLVYCTGVDHARKLAMTINDYKPRSAIFLSGETPKYERKTWVEWFRNGEVQFMCVFGLFLEAFDAPKVQRIVMARPTKNPQLYEQMLGRGTRTWPGTLDALQDATAMDRRRAIAHSPKPELVVLDFAGNAGKHHICRATDLLGGRCSDRVRSYARKLSEKVPDGRPVADLIDQAIKEVALMEEEEDRLRKIEARAAYRMRDVNPFGGGGPTIDSLSRPKLPATPKQIAQLVVLGVRREFAETCDRKRAGAILGKLMKKRGY